jgi:hypothetical protein
MRLEKRQPAYILFIQSKRGGKAGKLIQLRPPFPALPEADALGPDAQFLCDLLLLQAEPKPALFQ